MTPPNQNAESPDDDVSRNLDPTTPAHSSLSTSQADGTLSAPPHVPAGGGGERRGAEHGQIAQNGDFNTVTPTPSKHSNDGNDGIDDGIELNDLNTTATTGTATTKMSDDATIALDEHSSSASLGYSVGDKQGQMRRSESRKISRHQLMRVNSGVHLPLSPSHSQSDLESGTTQGGGMQSATRFGGGGMFLVQDVLAGEDADVWADHAEEISEERSPVFVFEVVHSIGKLWGWTSIMLFVPIFLLLAWLLIPLPVADSAPDPVSGSAGFNTPGSYWLFGGIWVPIFHFVLAMAVYETAALSLPAPSLTLRLVVTALLSGVLSFSNAVWVSAFSRTSFEVWIMYQGTLVVFICAVVIVAHVQFAWWPANKAAYKAADLKVRLVGEQIGRTLILLVISYVVAPLWCLVYVSIFRASGTSQIVQIGLGFLYIFIFYPLFWTLIIQSRRLDVYSRTLYTLFGWDSPRQVRPVVVWVVTLFYLAYYRVLFTSVTNVGTFLVLTALNLVEELAVYPMRMTETYRKWRAYLLQKLLDAGPMGIYILRKIGADLFLTEQAFRHKVATEFFFVAQAQRMSLISFGLSLLLLHNTYNNPSFPYQQGEAYDRLVGFVWFMLALEWTGSTIVWGVIRFLGVDCVLSGAQWTIHAGSTRALFFSALFILFHVYLFLHSKYLPGAF